MQTARRDKNGRSKKIVVQTDNRKIEKLEATLIEELADNQLKFPYYFKFAALTEGTFNGVFYPNEELNKKNVIDSFNHVPITINHSENITDKVGETVEVWWNDKLKRIEGRGKIEDTELGRKVADSIEKKLITNVSVEVLVKHDKTDSGIIARELEGVGLSLVLRGACRPPQCGIIETGS